MTPTTKLPLIVIIVLLALHTAPAQVPSILNYQGRVTVGGTNLTTNAAQFKFALVGAGNNTATTATATGSLTGGFLTGINLTGGGSGYTTAPAVTITDPTGSGATATATVVGGAVTDVKVNMTGSGYTAPVITIAAPPANIVYPGYWNNTGAASSAEPASAVSVPVAQGLYSVLLGDTALANMAALPSTVFSNTNVNLRVWFSPGGGSPFVQLSPDQRLGASGYALRAANVDVPGELNTLSGLYATIGGGLANTASANYAVLGGGRENTASGEYATIGGGWKNFATNYATVSGGTNNTASGKWSAIGGGDDNTASGDNATIGGGEYNTARGVYATIGGGFGNTNSGYGATIGGGEDNTASGEYATIGGGYQNTNSGGGATIGGGEDNTASRVYATVSGGVGNTASGDYATIGGGENNTVTALGTNAVIGGGRGNSAQGPNATIGGGRSNTATAYGTIPGGDQNAATASDTFAAGYRSKATNVGAFVWGYSPNSTVSTNGYSFTVRATGGVRFISSTADSATVAPVVGGTSGVWLAPNSGAWASLSDSNSKTKITAIKPREILSKVAAMPVTEWEYKSDPDKRRYIGPMAQDFHEAFGLGYDDKSISTLDSDGVMYAAIQGLVEEIKLRDEKIAKLEAWSREQGASSRSEIEALKAKSAEVDALKAKLEAVEERLNSLPPAP